MSFWKEIYTQGWRWVVLVIWSLPYAVGAFYDFLQGQEYLPKDCPTISQIIPSWGYQVWIVIGVSLFVIVTLEGSYRYVARVLSKQVVAENIVKISEKEAERKQVISDIPNVFHKLKERLDILVANADITTVDMGTIDKVMKHMADYLKKQPQLASLIDTGWDYWNIFASELRHILDGYEIGLKQLINADSEAKQLENELAKRRLGVGDTNLNKCIKDYQTYLYNINTANLLLRYVHYGGLDTGELISRIQRAREDIGSEMYRILAEMNKYINQELFGGKARL